MGLTMMDLAEEQELQIDEAKLKLLGVPVIGLSLRIK